MLWGLYGRNKSDDFNGRRKNQMQMTVHVFFRMQLLPDFLFWFDKQILLQGNSMFRSSFCAKIWIHDSALNFTTHFQIPSLVDILNLGQWIIGRQIILPMLIQDQNAESGAPKYTPIPCPTLTELLSSQKHQINGIGYSLRRGLLAKENGNVQFRLYSAYRILLFFSNYRRSFIKGIDPEVNLLNGEQGVEGGL